VTNEQDQTNTVRPIRKRQLLAPGESAVASIGISLAFILLATTMGSTWWALRMQRSSVARTRAGQIRATGELLAGSIESMLTADGLSAVRRLVTETAAKHELAVCRIVTADDKIIADADPRKITVTAPPSTWPEAQIGEASDTLDRDTLSLTYPLAARGRNVARLELAAVISAAAWGSWEAQVGSGVIGVSSLLALLFLYRHARARLKPASAVREALLAIDGGADDEIAELSEDLGAEASIWNTLLAKKRDLHEQLVAQRAEKSLNSNSNMPADLDAACDAMSQGLVLLNSDLVVKYSNGAAAVFLGVKRDEMSGGLMTELVQDQEVLDLLRQVLVKSGGRRGIIEIDQRGEGAGGVLRFIARPVRRSDSAAAMLVIEDITQQRVAEEARHAFVAQASHELRTPLTNIRLHVETAIEDGEDEPEIRAQSLNVINHESRRLERIVAEMLSVAEIDAGSFSLRRDDVTPLAMLEQLEEDYRPQAKHKNVELVFDLPPKLPSLQGDRDKIMLAFHNLLGNAIKYTPDGGRVTVQVEVEDEKLLVQVADNGIGISEEDAPRVFEKFYRAKDARVSKITGSGLGLALARQVIQLHGGDITVESRIDKGSTFTLALPIDARAA